MVFRIVTRVAAFAVMMMTSGCASLSQAWLSQAWLSESCVAPARAMASAELIFGRNIGDRIAVSDKAFADFVARDITPRFPDGLTVLDANGQWRDGSRRIPVRERSKVVLITFDDDAQKRADLMAIAENYKIRFSQQSVLVQVRNVCASF